MSILHNSINIDTFFDACNLTELSGYYFYGLKNDWDKDPIIIITEVMLTCVYTYIHVKPQQAKILLPFIGYSHHFNRLISSVCQC